MEEKPKVRECWGCKNYKAYYTKGYCHFDRQDFGRCTKHDKDVKKHDGCEHWWHYHYGHKEFAVRSLCDLLENLAEIKEILMEDREDEVNFPTKSKSPRR